MHFYLSKILNAGLLLITEYRAALSASTLYTQILIICPVLNKQQNITHAQKEKIPSLLKLL